jgi:hypothetical protein
MQPQPNAMYAFQQLVIDHKLPSVLNIHGMLLPATASLSL